MELRHLRYFAAVAETRHFGRAADRLHIAQPALSQAIRQLEKELGTTLFTRTTRHVSLTAAGEFLRGEAERVLEAVDDSVRGVQRIGEGQFGLVRLGFTGTAAFTALPRITRALTRDLPGVAVEVHADLLTPALATRLSEGSLDLAVLRPPVSPGGLRLRSIEVEPLLLAAPAEHPLAGQASITMADLRSETFVLYSDAQSAVNAAVHRSCSEAGFTPEVDHRAPGTTALLSLVAANLGIALVPRSVQALSLAGVTFRSVVDSHSIELACAWHEDHLSPLVDSVLAALEADGVFADSPHTQDRPDHPLDSPVTQDTTDPEEADR